MEVFKGKLADTLCLADYQAQDILELMSSFESCSRNRMRRSAALSQQFLQEDMFGPDTLRNVVE